MFIFKKVCEQEWTGAWSDGSPEWTPELIEELNQTDEDDGMFWITFEDFLENFNMFSVCRLLTGKKFFHRDFDWLTLRFLQTMLERCGRRLCLTASGTKQTTEDAATFPLGIATPNIGFRWPR